MPFGESNQEESSATYSASIMALVPASLATDIFTIAGGSGKVIRITSISISGNSGGGNNFTFQLIKRSAANTGGTSTTLTNVPHSSANLAAVATVKAYTANPTALGASVGLVRSARIFLPATNNSLGQISLWEFGYRTSQALTLLSSSELICINLAGVSVNTGSLDLFIEWIES